MHDFDAWARKLAPHYQHFRVAERLLFTGHSHQAWPDVALEGQQEAFHMAAEKVDHKWEVIFYKLECLREYLRAYYKDSTGYYSFSANTHDLFIRWLSALPLRKQPCIICTDGEFYTIRRQLARLQEEGIDVRWLPSHPTEELPGRIQQILNEKVACIVCSHVFFQSGLVNTSLLEIDQVADKNGIPLLIDDYHGTHVIPLPLDKLENSYVLGGGYKYLQWGEGNCFLRFPQHCQLRPAVTGWLASFEHLEEGMGQDQVLYDAKNERFFGATFEPSSCFRAARVAHFFKEQGLSATLLQAQYQAQIHYLRTQFRMLACDEGFIQLLHHKPIEQHGGFLAWRCPKAQALCKNLNARGLACDARGEVLRLGVAPYIRKAQIDEALAHLEDEVLQMTLLKKELS